MTTAAIDPKRRALGKGLDSLLPRAQVSPVPETEGGRPREIPLNQIDHNPFQTRSRVNEEQLAELAASIAANGVVQPVLVRPIAGGRFQLIAGERRWRASQIAGKTTVPAILRQVSDEQAMEITIVENLQRADLNPMEQARAFERLSRRAASGRPHMQTPASGSLLERCSGIGARKPPVSATPRSGPRTTEYK